MKTTIDIPERDLLEALQFSGAKTKREAIQVAVQDYNRRQRLVRLSKSLGTFEKFMDGAELKRMRADR